MNANQIIDRISEEVCGKYPADPIERLNREVGMLRYELRKALMGREITHGRDLGSKLFHLSRLVEIYKHEGNAESASLYQEEHDNLVADVPTLEDIDQWAPDAMQQAKEYAEAMNG